MMKLALTLLCVGMLGLFPWARAMEKVLPEKAEGLSMDSMLEGDADVMGEDFDFDAVLQLDAYTFALDAQQLAAKEAMRGLVVAEGLDVGLAVPGEALVTVRSREEAEQVAAAYGAELVTYNEQAGFALLGLSDALPLGSWLALSAREDVPLPVLEPNRTKQFY